MATIPLPEGCRLATLTKKSTMRGGTDHDGMIVSDLIEKEPAALIWIYYAFERITFTDDVLEELNIFERHRIEKPGVNRGMYQERKLEFAKWKAANGEPAMLRKMQMAEKRRNKREYREFLYRDMKDFSKARLTRINHGHR